MTLLAAVLAGAVAAQTASQPPATRPVSGPERRAAETELLDAARLTQADTIRALLDRGTPVDATDWRGYTPLFWASAAGRADVVNLLLARGASASHRAGDGTTALMLAAANGHLQIAQALVARGAPPAALKNGVTARQLAERRGFPDIVAMLDQAQIAGERLLQAVRDGNDGATRQLITLGAPVNASDARGVTPLMQAARGGNLGMLQFLLARGADPSIADTDGRTVWEWAESSPDLGRYVVTYLTDRGLKRSPAPPSPAQNVPPPSIAQSLRSMSAALGRITPATPAVRAAKSRVERALAQLLTLSARWPAESPEDYRANMAAEARVIEQLSSSDAAVVATTLTAIGEDLEAKLEHCTRSGGALGGSVTVRVRTVQGGSEVKSWQVFYLPKIFEAIPTADADVFPLLSSPTEEILVPGRYVMWVRDPATSRLGERTIVKVGEGRRELLVELPIPSAGNR